MFLRTPSLLAAISQQSLEEVSKSNIFFVKPQLPGPGGYIFYVSGGITLDRDTADECFRRSTTLQT